MPLIAKGKQFQNPPEGLFQGVCVDVVDMGMQENRNNGKMQHNCRIVFQIDEPMEDGRRFIVNRWFTVSLSDQSNLLPFLENWRGKRLTQEEKDGFDLETLIGVNGQVQILHNSDSGQTYANIAAVLPWNTKMGQKMTPDADYTRVQDREQVNPNQGNPSHQGQAQGQRGAAHQAHQPERTAQATRAQAASTLRRPEQIDELDEIPF
jgi:hypothetical protein